MDEHSWEFWWDSADELLRERILQSTDALKDMPVKGRRYYKTQCWAMLSATIQELLEATEIPQHLSSRAATKRTERLVDDNLDFEVPYHLAEPIPPQLDLYNDYSTVLDDLIQDLPDRNNTVPRTLTMQTAWRPQQVRQFRVVNAQLRLYGRMTGAAAGIVVAMMCASYIGPLAFDLGGARLGALLGAGVLAYAGFQLRIVALLLPVIVIGALCSQWVALPIWISVAALTALWQFYVLFISRTYVRYPSYFED